MILLISVFFGCMLAIAHYGHIKTGRGAEEYYIAGRRVGGLVSALTYSATTYSAFMMVGLVGFVYAGGVAALGFELTYLIGTALLLLIFAPRFLLAGRKWGYLTPTELLRDRYQSTLIGVIATLMCLIFLIPYISIQAQGAGYLMNTLTGGGIPYEAGLMFILVVIAFCAWWGGLRGVAWSDAAQAFVMMLTSVVLLFFVVYSFLGGWGNFFSTLEGSYPELLTTPGPGGFFNFSKFIGLTIPWFFFALSNPQVAQRLFISKSIGAAKNMIRGFLVFGFIYTVICVLLGLMTRMLYLDLAKPDLAMPTLLAEVPTVLALVVMLGILAAAVTTADSIILSLSSMVGRDIYRVSRRKTTEKGELILGRIVIVALAAIVAFFAWRPLGMIVELAVASSAGLLVLVPSFIGAFFWRRASAAGSISSIIVGGIVVGTLYFSKIYPLGQWPGVWGIIFSTAIFISVSLLTKPPPKADEFLSHLREELGKRGIP
jgi:SSS family solute:Na+ symporter